MKSENNIENTAAAKLSERKTVHEWLNAKGTPREENGKPLCLLRRLAIALGVHDEPKLRPDSPGAWWMVRQDGTHHIGRAEVIYWGDEDDGKRVLAWTAGGVHSRCDLINNIEDSGTRWVKAVPPILGPNAGILAAADEKTTPKEMTL